MMGNAAAPAGTKLPQPGPTGLYLRNAPAKPHVFLRRDETRPQVSSSKPAGVVALRRRLRYFPTEH